MFKRMYVMLLTLSVLLALAAGYLTAAAADEEPELTQVGDYRLKGTVLVKYTGEEEDLVIPAELGITEIGWDAFIDIIDYEYFPNMTLRSVVIPEGVEKITGGLQNCRALERVTLPDSVTEIGYGAFSECVSLVEINLPEGLTIIGSGAFAGCEALPAINIPDSVTSIGNSAFANCKALLTVKIPYGVTVIEDCTFSDCVSLLTVEIPDSVLSIEGRAFAGCANLSAITIPKSVIEIGSIYGYPYGIFDECVSLENFYVDPDNTAFSDLDGVLFDKAETTLICFPPGRADSPYIVPEGVTVIREGAFWRCENLTGIVLPDRLETIGYDAFRMCRNLENITVPDGVIDFGQSAFDSTKWYADQPDGLVVLGKVLYRYKGSMPDNTVLTLPDGIIGIASYAFAAYTAWGNYRLAGIALPDSIKYIGDCAFAGCYKLKNITIPKNVMYIGQEVFRGNECLSAIHVNAENKSYTGIDGVLFNKGKTALIHYPAAKTGKSYSIPDGVTDIMDNAFANCWLESVTIPDSVQEIHAYAFSQSKTLKNIIVPESVKKIGEGAFEHCYGLEEITIQNGVETIEYAIFRSCFRLQAIVIPASVTHIDEYAFISCENVKKISVDPDNQTYSDINGVLYNKDKSVLIYYPDGKPGTSYTVPSSVTEINDWAFERNSALKTLTIGGSVTAGGRGIAYSYGRDRQINCYAGTYIHIFLLENGFKEYTLLEMQLGSVSGSGEIGVGDARLLLQYLTDKTILTAEQLDMADVDGSGSATINDARLILQYLVGKIDVFPRKTQ
ncbi:MAG: leucine-rich repeat protein [Oscillospiraceae bacterium]|nr:leucine-rich repeat protein [Oscillospiraceae bacterium]